MRQRKPVVYQEVDGRRRELDGWYLLEDGYVSVRLASYDSSIPVVIDPVLIYSSYLGGGDNRGQDIVVDPAGNAYVAGFTSATGVQGNRDAFVMKINPAGFRRRLHDLCRGGPTTSARPWP